MISEAEVKELADNFTVIPVVKTLFSGSETPLSIFEKLGTNRPGSFLLESAEAGVWSRYSFIVVGNLGMLTFENSEIHWNSESDLPATPEVSSLGDLSSLEVLELIQTSWNAAPTDDLPPLVSGMVGFLGWDTIHEIEKLQPRKPKEYRLPDLAVALLRDLVVVDHLDSSLKLISNIYLHTGSDIAKEYHSARQRIEKMQSDLLSPTNPFLADVKLNIEPEFRHRTQKNDFIAAIERAKQNVVAGDVFQVVLSQRFEIENQAAPLDVYRSLRALNPSPYMYLLNFEDSEGPFAVVGSSPEALVRVQKSRAVLHPIAGSRPRGESSEADNLLAEELRSDAKEKAEHLMLVDLARNDLLKVCVPDSVAVSEFMTVERYSHIMHLVSTVEGTIEPGKSAVDVLRATFPAGTLSGAPKPRALEIIEELEPSNRGLFGGVVGYLDFAGNADLAIAIRTAVLRGGLGYVQAGAGIVLDSDPESEHQETLNKASAPLRAIAVANSMNRLLP